MFGNREIACGECFAPVCAHVSRRHVHSVVSLPTQENYSKVFFGNWRCMRTEVAKKQNLERCAHAYGSHEHRLVRSTLRTQFSDFQKFSQKFNSSITIWILWCAESESDVRIVFWMRVPLRRHVSTMSACMRNSVLPNFAKFILLQIPSVFSIISSLFFFTFLPKEMVRSTLRGQPFTWNVCGPDGH